MTGQIRIGTFLFLLLSGCALDFIPRLTMDDEYRLHGREIRSVAWHAASGRLASSGHDGRVFVWTADTVPVELAKAPSDAANLQFSPDGRTLMGGGWFKLLRRFQAHDLCGADITLSPDNRYLATTSDDTSVRLWDLRTPPPPQSSP